MDLFRTMVDFDGVSTMNDSLQFVEGTIATFDSHRRLAERAVAQVPDALLGKPLDEHTNSISVIMKHVAGNLISRWTDFLTTDGEKPWRNRDGEFVDTFASRAELMEFWDKGWGVLEATLQNLSAEDLARSVTIRGEKLSVPVAIERSLGHTCYHVGQIVTIARIHAGHCWNTLTIPRAGMAAVEPHEPNP
jgi:hypothetical protein